MKTSKLYQLNSLLEEFRETELDPMINFNAKTKQEAFNTALTLNLRQSVNDVSEYTSFLLYKRRQEEKLMHEKDN